MPKLSIGIPVFNGQEFLLELLDSLLAQTFRDFEILICGNASNDQTPEICREYERRDCRVHYFHNSRNLGAIANFNRVFELSTAPLFKWAAHDDLYYDGYLAACVSLLEANPDTVLAHTGTAFINERGEPLHYEQETDSFIDRKTGRRCWADVPSIGDTPVAVNRFWQVLTRARWGTHMFGVVRREALQQTSLLPNFAGSNRAMLAELALLGRFRCANEPLFLTRFHANVSWARSFLSTDDKRYSRRIRQIKGFFGAPKGKPIGALSKSACFALVAAHSVKVVARLVAQGDPRTAADGYGWPGAHDPALRQRLGAALWAYSPALPPEMLIARYANDASKFIDVAGARAHVRDQGNPAGIPLVLIHGAGGSLHVWEEWVRELGTKARLISVDLPGHGLTGAWPRHEYTVDAYVDFVEALVDALNLDRFVLAGHSLGGGVAWTFAATRPDRVSQIILIDAAGESRDAAWPTRLARLPIVGEIGIQFRPERWVRRKLLEAYADPAMVTTERVKRAAELQRFPGNREATLLRARTQEPLDARPLGRLTIATLILWGAKDRWVPVADAYRFQNDIKAAKLEVFEKLGHNPMEEDPKATAAAVAAFLKPIPPGLRRLRIHRITIGSRVHIR
jgi:pimeloyl-ACP methyl ester carboxylesterase/glycosyltransferase involved in cell wall biosynthesis